MVIQALILAKSNFLQNASDLFHQIAIGHFEEFRLNVVVNDFTHFINFIIISLTLVDLYYIG